MMALREIDGGLAYYGQFAHSLPTDINYFPIGVWFESVLSQTDIDLDKAIDINLYVALTRNSNLSLLGPNGMHAFLQTEWLDGQAGSQAAIDNPAVASWILGDEIDMQQGPGQGYTSLSNLVATLPNDGRFLYNNYG